MSVQVFFQGLILETDEFLSSGRSLRERASRVVHYSEDWPLGFLNSQGLPSLLLGSATPGQFLLVLPEHAVGAAREYFAAAAQDASREGLRLIFASTENLGTWAIIRERLWGELSQLESAPGSPDFQPFDPAADEETALEPVPVPWSVLRGNVDRFEPFLAAADTVETHVARSLMFKNFFAGELPRLTQGKAEIAILGGDGFAITGPWETLLTIAPEIARLFERFAAENLGADSAADGRTMSMALALPQDGETEGAVYRRCGAMLETAKTFLRGGFHLFGRTIEWQQLTEAEGIKDLALRLVREFGCSTQFIAELLSFYPELQTGRRGVQRFERPWRFYRRLAVTLDPNERRSRSREYVKVRTELAAEVIGKNVGQARLRPTGRVALEWAYRLTQTEPA
ncbi:MAG: hypothetical protein SFV18_02600 [Bryobacteraceae bacterium]|nr:hypothetical protein [Bryobacteraceae bacterium]